VESRHQRSAKVRSIKKKAKAEGPIAGLSLPNIAQFLEDYGEINIRTHSEIGCVATAADEDCTYATLVRRGGESLGQFLILTIRSIANPWLLTPHACQYSPLRTVTADPQINPILSKRATRCQTVLLPSGHQSRG
jgi:hypothetical protein